MEDPSAIFFAEFLNSAEGLVERLTSDLENLRGGTTSTEDGLKALLWGFHSLKGNSSFVPDCPMTPLAHAAEEAVAAAQEGRVSFQHLVAPLGEAIECLQAHLTEYSERGAAAPPMSREEEVEAALGALADVGGQRSDDPRYFYAGEDVTDLLEILDEADRAGDAGGGAIVGEESVGSAVARLLRLATDKGSSAGLWAAAADGPGPLLRWLVQRIEREPARQSSGAAPAARAPAEDETDPEAGDSTGPATADSADRQVADPAAPAAADSMSPAAHPAILIAGEGVIEGAVAPSAIEIPETPPAAAAASPSADAVPEVIGSGASASFTVEATRGSEDAPPESPVGAPNVSPTPRRFQVDADAVDGFLDYAGELRVVADRLAHLYERLRTLDVPSGVAPVWRRTAEEFVADFGAFRDEFETLAGKLQKSLLDIRQVPVRRLLSRHADLIRRLGRQLGKQVNPIIEGAETTADKTVIEQLEIPLTHMVRNALDHGIEIPTVRARAVKPPHGTVTLRAGTQGEYFTLEVLDDGRGIDVEALRRVAVARGKLTEAESTKLGAADLLFHPGLSSRHVATEFSGRGVGMDVVRAAVRQMGGTVEVESEPELGTRFTIRVRSAGLSSVPCVPARIGDHRFFIPHEATRAWFADNAGEIDDVPLVDLSSSLSGLPSSSREGERVGGGDGGACHVGTPVIVVLEGGGETFHLRVDEAGQKVDVVAQPLDQRMMRSSLWSMASVGGDQEIKLILDVDELAIASDAEASLPAEPVPGPVFTDWRPDEGPRTVLVFEAGDKSCVVDAKFVDEILDSRPVTPVPGAASYILGLVRSRSRVVPVFDSRQLLGLEATDHCQDRMVVVMQFTQGVVRRWVALDVDRVAGITTLRDDDESPLVLDLGRLLDPEVS